MWFFAFYLVTPVVTVIVAVLYHRGILRNVYLTSKIQGPSLWEFGTVHAKKLINSADTLNHLSKMCKDFSYKPWGFRSMTGQYVYVVSDPETIEAVYKSKDLVNKSDQIYGTISDYIGGGLLVLNGERWKLHRKIINPAFRRSIYHCNANILSERAQNVVEKLKKKADGSSINIAEVIDNGLLDLSMRFFSSVDSMFQFKIQFMQAYTHVSFLATLKFTNPVLHWLKMKLHKPTRQEEKNTRSVIARSKINFLKELNRAKTKLQSDQPQNTFEHILQNSKLGEILDDQELYEECLQLIVAASEPTATATRAAILMLALHQDVQQRAFEEQQQIVSDNGQTTLKDLDKMEFLGMVIKETLRLFPVGCVLCRKVDGETNLKGKIIPTGSLVLMNIMALHRNPDNFEDPLKFNPNRFLPGLSESRHAYSYVPFSSGTRSCVGQMHGTYVMKVLLSRIVRSFIIQPDEGLRCVTDIKTILRTTLNIPDCFVKLESRTLGTGTG